MCLDNLWPPDHEPFCQPRTQRLAKIGHLVKISNAAMIYPVEQLLGPQFGLLFIEPRVIHQLANLHRTEANDIDAAIGTGSDLGGQGDGINMAGNLHGWHIRAVRRKIYRNREHPKDAASIAVAAPRSR